MKLDRRSYSSGHFELLIDGHKSTPILKSLEGGFTKASLVTESVGTRLHQIKHVSTMEVDPFAIEFSLSGAKDVLNWIGQSWNKEFGRRNGQITHANSDYEETLEHQFYEALITETTFPTLDGSSKEAAYIKVKMQPETISTKTLTGSKYTSNSNAGNIAKHKLWMPSSFRFSIEGMDEMQYVNKIDSFTIKQSIKKHYSGEGQFPQIEPTKLEFPNITGTIALRYADSLLKWNEMITNSKAGANKNGHKTGSIEFLSPDRKSTIFRINLDEVGLLSAAVEPAKANAESIKRVKFELFVGQMKIDQADQSGLQS